MAARRETGKIKKKEMRRAKQTVTRLSQSLTKPDGSDTETGKGSLPKIATQPISTPFSNAF